MVFISNQEVFCHQRLEDEEDEEKKHKKQEDKKCCSPPTNTREFESPLTSSAQFESLSPR